MMGYHINIPHLSISHPQLNKDRLKISLFLDQSCLRVFPTFNQIAILRYIKLKMKLDLLIHWVTWEFQKECLIFQITKIMIKLNRNGVKIYSRSYQSTENNNHIKITQYRNHPWFEFLFKCFILRLEEQQNLDETHKKGK